MKTNSITSLSGFAAIAVSLALFGTLANTAAQETGAAKGGGTKLIQLSGQSVTPISAPTKVRAMSCSKCINDLVQVRDTDSKGGARALVAIRPLTKTVARHGCEDCRTGWSVVGHGKAKVSVAAHKCAADGGLAGCNVSGSSSGKKFEVAPLK